MTRRWLVTVTASQLKATVSALRALGCEVQPEAAVPVDGDAVIPVSGPPKVESRLRKVPGVTAVHDDSDLTLYDR